MAGGGGDVLLRPQRAGGANAVARGLRVSRLLEATVDAGVAGLLVRAAQGRRLLPGNRC